MIEQILIIAFVVFGYTATFWEGHIFEKIGDWMEDKFPEWVNKPLWQCPICCAFWHGTAIYWLALHNYGKPSESGENWVTWAVAADPWYNWLLVVIGAMGINAVLVKITGALDDIADKDTVNVKVLPSAKPKPKTAEEILAMAARVKKIQASAKGFKKK